MQTIQTQTQRTPSHLLNVLHLAPKGAAGSEGPAPSEASWTHEEYVHAVREAVLPRLNADERKAAMRIKLVVGYGDPMLRGVTYYGRWINGQGPDNPEPIVEICLAGSSSILQIACTTIHELGHVLAGPDAGHGKDWKAACGRLGLTTAQAAGQQYEVSHLADDVQKALLGIPDPNDGRPVTHLSFTGIAIKPKPCPLGIGTRGGKSRGKGSGSRSIKAECPESDCGYVVRLTRKWIEDPEYGPPSCPKHGHTMVTDLDAHNQDDECGHVH